MYRYIILVFLCAFAFDAIAENRPVMNGPHGYFVQEDQSWNTGISLAPKVELTQEQLDAVMATANPHSYMGAGKREPVLLETTRELVGWDTWHLHLVYKVTQETYAVIGGDDVVRKLQRKVDYESKEFNLFFIFASIYIILMMFAHRYIAPQVPNVPTFSAFFVIVFAAIATTFSLVVAVDATVTMSTIVFLAIVVPIVFLAIVVPSASTFFASTAARRRFYCKIGIGLACLAMVFEWFLV